MYFVYLWSGEEGQPWALSEDPKTVINPMEVVGIRDERVWENSGFLPSLKKKKRTASTGSFVHKLDNIWYKGLS